MRKLIIDTTDNTKTKIALDIDGDLYTMAQDGPVRSQIALVLIDKLLRKNNLTPQDIDQISVNSGPGSFTGTRVGVSIANALGFGLSVKVNGSKEKQVAPRYV